MPLSSCSDILRGGEVVASGTLVMGLGAESRAPVSVGSLTGGAEVTASGSSYIVGPVSFGELSVSSIVSIVCFPVASLSASVACLVAKFYFGCTVFLQTLCHLLQVLVS